MAGTKFITWITDFITSSERSKVILSTIISVIKMETKFLDLFKDLGLSIYLLGRGEYSFEEWNDFGSKNRYLGQKKSSAQNSHFSTKYSAKYLPLARSYWWPPGHHRAANKLQIRDCCCNVQLDLRSNVPEQPLSGNEQSNDDIWNIVRE